MAVVKSCWLLFRVSWFIYFCRALKAQKANTRGRGIGRGEQTILKGKQAVVRGRGRGNRANQQVRSATSSTVTTAMGPGRGRGDRRGRGRGQRRPEAPESAASVSVFATPAPQVCIIKRAR